MKLSKGFSWRTSILTTIISIVASCATTAQAAMQMPGNCGQGGCEKGASPSELISAMLGSPEVKKRLGDENIHLIYHLNDLIMKYRIETESGCNIIARIEFLEMPIKIDNVDPIQVGHQYLIITTESTSTCPLRN